MRRPSFVVPLFLPLTLAACDSGGEGGRTAADIFDASVPRWTVTVEAEVGGADEAEGMILVGVAGGVLLDGDRFALGETQSMEVRFYDGSGAFLGARGRRGEGPGEFTFINGVDSPDGQGVTAWDLPANRLTAFPGSEGVVETWAAMGADRPGTLSPVGILPSGAVVFLGGPGEGGRTVLGEQRDTASLVVSAPGGVTTVHTRPGAERFVFSAGDVNGAPVVVFGAEARATVLGSTILVGGTDAPALDRLDASGASTGTDDLAVPAAPASPDAVAAVRQAGFAADSALLARLAPYNPGLDLVGRVADLRDIFDGLPARDTLPRFSEIQGDRAGHLWVREYVFPAADSVVWTRLDGALEPEGRLVVPSGWRILDLEGDRALVAFRDDIDRWVVQALRLGATP